MMWQDIRYTDTGVYADDENFFMLHVLFDSWIN